MTPFSDTAVHVSSFAPQLVVAYAHRGLAYHQIGETAKSEADFAKYKELTGKDAP